MNKILLFAIVLLVFQSCDLPPQQVAAPPKVIYTKLDLFVKRFLKNHSNMNDNDILKQEATDQFKKQLITFFKDSSGISNIRLHAVSINKRGKGYIIHFMSDDFFQTNVFPRKSDIDVFALVDEKLARGIKQSEDEKYFITKYKKLMYLEKEALPFVTNDRVWNNDVGFDKDMGNSYGNYILETKDIKHY